MNQSLGGAVRWCALSLAVAASSTAQEAAPAAPVPAQSPPRFGRDVRLELTLAMAFEVAVRHNLGLEIATLTAKAAEYDVRSAWGTFAWTVGARAGVSDAEIDSGDTSSATQSDTQEFSLDLSRPFSTGGTLRASFDTVNRRANGLFQQSGTADVVGLSYVQPLLRGAWREYATADQRAAELEARRLGEAERAARQRLLQDVANAYWDLVAARDELEVARSNVALGLEQVQQNQSLLDAGLGTQVEVLTAQTEVATREETRLLAEVNLLKADDALKQLLIGGTDADKWETTVIPTTPLPPAVAAATAVDWRTALEVAIQHRSDLRQQRYTIDEAAVRHETTRNLRHPQLDLDLSANSQGFSGDASEAFDETAQWDFPTYRAALVFSYPLGNKAARGSERAAWTRLRTEKLRYDDLEATVAFDVREAVRQIAYQAEAVSAAEKTRELAERQLAAEEARYREQMSTNFEVLQFQQDLSRARASVVRARTRYAKALVGLEAAQGLLDVSHAP